MSDTATTVSHTPGPWHFDPENYGVNYTPGWGIVRLDEIGIGHSMGVTVHYRNTPGIVSLEPGPHQMANARLIASAPDLLDALQAAVARIEIANREGDPILSAWLPQARAAIARATAENPR